MKNGNRYEAGLLWRNRDLAVNRFKSTESKFNRNPEIATKYKETVNSYIESGTLGYYPWKKLIVLLT